MLSENMDILKRVAEELLEKETIVLEDIEDVLDELRPGQYERTEKEPEPEVKKASPRKVAKAPVEEENGGEAQETEDAQETDVVEAAEEVEKAEEEPAASVEKPKE